MREKIARIWADWDGVDEANDAYWEVACETADQILALLREEIEKAVLTREEVWEAYRADESSGDVVGIAEAQLQKILALLEVA